ncbi:MAG: peptidyl-prolyl cis-trans isomerase [Sedimentisphaerales bacterium]|nr:peptidyl-prolyl cis-trans isomerase [Sedimentisphaerales bacterium]
MKKSVLMFLLGVATAVIGYGAWRVATGRGLYCMKPKPSAKQSKPLDETVPKTTIIDTQQTVFDKGSTGGSEDSLVDSVVPAEPDLSPEEAAALAVKVAKTDPNIVGVIADYLITKAEFEKQFLQDLRPYSYGSYDLKTAPAEANSVLAKMVAEKAMALEMRKQGVLDDELIDYSIQKFKDRQLINVLMQKRMASELIVLDSEIEELMKTDPNLDRSRAEMTIKRAKANKIMQSYYGDVYQRSNVKKATANYSKAAGIHTRLLLHPIAERKVPFIRNHQIRNELTDDEKNILMATFNGGKVTLKDWFVALGEISPPRRPGNLDTPQGIDMLLEQALRTPLLVAEARRLGLDRDVSYRKQSRDYEDQNLLGYAKQAKGKELSEPTDEEIRAYFDANKDKFAENKSLKVDQIWCSDLKSAQGAKARLDAGESFEAVKKDVTIDKEAKASSVYPSTEGYFFGELWKGNAGDVLGPLKGMNQEKFRWRIVRILEKHPGEIPEFSEQMTNRVKLELTALKRTALLEKYGEELLEKYPHKIYYNRIKDINPLDIP